MVFILIQYFFMLMILYLLNSYLIFGVADYVHSKIKKDMVYAIGAVLLVAYIWASVLSVIFLDKENILLWYCLTILTLTFSALILLNDQTKSKKVEHPNSLIDYITNAKITYFNNRFVKILFKLRFLIYVVYICVIILNQLQALNILKNVPKSLNLYLSVNEYSFIILFAVCEMVKLFNKGQKGKDINEIQI